MELTLAADLIAAAAQEQLPQEQQAQHLIDAAQTLLGALPQHAESCLFLLCAAAEQMLARGWTDLAEECLLTLLQRFEHSPHVYAATMGVVYTSCAGLLFRTGKLKQAIDLAGKAVGARLKAFGLESAPTAQALYNLGLIYRFNNNPSEALRQFWSCRSVWMRVNGSFSSEIARVDCSLGLVLHIMGHGTDAFLMYNEAYQIYKRTQGKQSSSTKQARSLMNHLRDTALGTMYSADEVRDAIYVWKKYSSKQVHHHQGALQAVLQASGIKGYIYRAWAEAAVVEHLQALRSPDTLADTAVEPDAALREEAESIVEELLACFAEGNDGTPDIPPYPPLGYPPSPDDAHNMPPSSPIAATIIAAKDAQLAELRQTLDTEEDVLQFIGTVPATSHAPHVGQVQVPRSSTEHAAATKRKGPSLTVETQLVDVPWKVKLVSPVCVKTPKQAARTRIEALEDELPTIPEGESGQIAPPFPPPPPPPPRNSSGEGPRASQRRRMKFAPWGPEELWRSFYPMLFALGCFPFALRQKAHLEAHARQRAKPHVIEIEPDEEETRRLVRHLSVREGLSRKGSAILQRTPSTKITPELLAAAFSSRVRINTSPQHKANAAKAAIERKASVKKMKQLHWEPLPEEAAKGTIWDTSTQSSDVPKLDATAVFPDLEEAFAVPKIKKRASTAPKPVNQSKHLDFKHSYTITIALAQFGKLEVQTIVQAIREMDDTVLNSSGVKSLLDCTVRTIDVTPIRKHLEMGGDATKLGKAEQYALGISEIPDTIKRLQVMHLKATIPESIVSLENDSEIIGSAIREVVESFKLRDVLAMLLRLGNAVNRLAGKSEFKGFKITAVNGIITRTKTNNNQTLLDYFVRHVHHSMPELLTLMDDFTAVAGAARKPLSYHRAEIARTKRDVATLQNAWDTGDEAYARCLADFVPHIAQRVEVLYEKSQELESSYEELCRYLGEDPKITDADILFDAIQLLATSIERSTGRYEQELKRKANRQALLQRKSNKTSDKPAAVTTEASSDKSAPPTPPPPPPPPPPRPAPSQPQKQKLVLNTNQQDPAADSDECDSPVWVVTSNSFKDGSDLI